MAIYVPARGWTWTFIAFWIADFIGLVFWLNFRKMRMAFGSRLKVSITALAFFEWFLFIPVPEAMYIWSGNEDPWNDIPYIQWLCINLRTMGIILGFMLVSAYVFYKMGATRRGMRAGAYSIFVINAIGIFIVQAWRPNLNIAEGTARTPSQFITITMDWIYVAAAFFVSLGFVVMTNRRYSMFFDFTRRDKTLELSSAKGNLSANQKMQKEGRTIILGMTAVWIVILAGVTTYASLIIARRDQFIFSGSQIYYFHIQFWITRLAPIYSVLFAYPIMWAMYLLMWRMSSLQNSIKNASVNGKGADVYEEF